MGSTRRSADPVRSRSDLLDRAPGEWERPKVSLPALGAGRLLARACFAVEILRRVVAPGRPDFCVHKPRSSAMVPRTRSLYRLRDRDPLLQPGADLELAERLELLGVSRGASRPRKSRNWTTLAAGQRSGASGADRSVDLDPDAARVRTRCA